MTSDIHSFNSLILRCLLLVIIGSGLGTSGSKSAASPVVANQGGETPRFDQASCQDVYPAFSTTEFGKGRFRCGHLITKENYDLESSKIISLAVVITLRDNPESSPKPAPIIYLEGGPGLNGFPWGPEEASQYARFFKRDVIQFSQRGTYFSTPFLDCKEYRDMVVNNWETQWSARQWEDKAIEALNNCWKRLRKDNSFENSDNYNSRFNALDVANLITELGYEEANLYGFSYGTLLAQHVLSVDPDHVANVVLDGVLPLGLEPTSESESNADRSLKKVFEDCRKDTKCKEAYPDLEPFFNDVVEKLNDQPADLTIKVGETIYRKVKLDGSAFSQTLSGLLAQSDKIGEIPRIIYAAGNGHFNDIEQAYFSFDLSPYSALGMYYSVFCTEFTRFRVSGSFWQQVCNQYDPSNKSYGNIQISGNRAPILLFNGEYDPSTPPDYGAQVADALSVSPEYNLVSPITAHGSSLNGPKGEYRDCAKAIMRDFFDHPDQPPDQAACWKKIQIENPTVSFNTNNLEIPLHRMGLWWQDQQQKIVDTLKSWEESVRTWWEEQQKKLADVIKSWQEKLLAWWQEQQKKAADELEKWWLDFQRKLVEWFEEQIITWLNQCLGAGLLPAGLLGVAWVSRRHLYRGRRDGP